MERRAGDILHAFHEADEFGAVFCTARREADAAISHDGSCHAVIDAGLKCIIPTDLAIIMGVKVNKPRRDDMACCIYRVLCWTEVGSNGGNASIFHCNIQGLALRACAVKDGAVSKN